MAPNYVAWPLLGVCFLLSVKWQASVAPLSIHIPNILHDHSDSGLLRAKPFVSKT